MKFAYLRQLPTPEELKKKYPLSQELIALKKERDQMITDVLTGKDN